MGKIKYLNEIEKFIQKTPVFNIDSIKKIISIKKGNEKYVYLLINKMLKKGKIKRLTKGFYTVYDDPTLAVFCFKPSYIGLQDALSIYNLTEQETNPIIITTKKIRTGIREILTRNVLLKRIPPEYFFGFSYIKYSNINIPASDIEKTLIDMVYFKQILDKENIKQIKKIIDKNKLKKYLKKYPKEIKTKVIKLIE